MTVSVDNAGAAVSRCACGQVELSLGPARAISGTHLICYCDDCRGFAQHLGADRVLEPGGGLRLFQTLPGALQILRGGEHLACLRWSTRGMYRYYAACCGTPLANRMAKRGLPFIGLVAAPIEPQTPLGKVSCVSFSKFAEPGGPRADRGVAQMSLRVMSRLLSGLINPQHRACVLDDPDIPVTVVTRT